MAFVTTNGFWSLIGRDSINEAATTPTNASLNLAGFDMNLPWDWDGLVLHEFGHALGFLHEHQSPTNNCDLEFRWADDPGYLKTTNQYGGFIPYTNADGTVYRPGIYTILGGPPDKWPKEKTDDAMRQINNASGYFFGPFDVHSIMMYSFDPSFYVNGTNSSCYTPETTSLSEGDLRGMLELYPFNAAQVSSLMARKHAIVQNLLDAKSSTPELKRACLQALKTLR